MPFLNRATRGRYLRVLTDDRAGRTVKARSLYLDTSAYLCVLLGEKHADEIAKRKRGAELLSSVLLVLEARRNLTRLARERALTAKEFNLTLDLCESSVLPAVSTPRSLDLVHLRTALWFHSESPIDRFVTLDQTQSASAEELGLPVSTI